MRELREHARLAREALAVLRRLRGQHLERDRLAGRPVARAEDLAHAAAPGASQHLEAPGEALRGAGAAHDGKTSASRGARRARLGVWADVEISTSETLRFAVASGCVHSRQVTELVRGDPGKSRDRSTEIRGFGDGSMPLCLLVIAKGVVTSHVLPDSGRGGHRARRLLRRAHRRRLDLAQARHPPCRPS